MRDLACDWIQDSGFKIQRLHSIIWIQDSRFKIQRLCQLIGGVYTSNPQNQQWVWFQCSIDPITSRGNEQVRSIGNRFHDRSQPIWSNPLQGAQHREYLQMEVRSTGINQRRSRNFQRCVAPEIYVGAQHRKQVAAFRSSNKISGSMVRRLRRGMPRLYWQRLN